MYKYNVSILCNLVCIYIYYDIHIRPGRGCCPAQWIATAQGQCFLHVGMSVTVKWQLG